MISSSLTKGIWATVDRYTVIRHQWLCAKKASCGKTPNPVHMTGNVLFQQGKIRLQEFLGFFTFLPTPLGFHWQTQKGRQCSSAISASLVIFKSDSEQSHLPETKLLQSREFKASNHAASVEIFQRPPHDSEIQSSIIKQQKVTSAGMPQNLFGLLVLEGQSFGLLERKSMFYLQPFFLSSSLPFSTT